MLNLVNYFEEYERLISPTELFKTLNSVKELILKTKQNNGKVIIIGNGGSAGTASHIALDLTKQAGVRAIAFSDSAMLTAFGNDYGYELWAQKAFEFYSDPHDILICLSVSGESKNLLMATEIAKKNNHSVIGLTGRRQDNNLAKNSDISLWVDSHAYNIVECIHMIWLGAIVDLLVGRSVYEVS